MAPAQIGRRLLETSLKLEIFFALMTKRAFSRNVSNIFQLQIDIREPSFRIYHYSQTHIKAASSIQITIQVSLY